MATHTLFLWCAFAVIMTGHPPRQDRGRKAVLMDVSVQLESHIPLRGEGEQESGLFSAGGEKRKKDATENEQGRRRRHEQ